MSEWLSKRGPLAGVLAGLLIVVVALLAPHPPGDGATGAQVIAWYASHGKAAALSDLATGLSLFFLVAFAAVMTRYIRHGDRWIASGAVAGAGCAAAGFAALRCFDLVLATDVTHLTPASAQTLNLLENDFFLPAVIGFGLFGVLGGLAVVSGQILAKWMGWVLFAFGIAVLIPPLSPFAIVLILLWVMAAGIWMAGQGPPVRAQITPLAGDHLMR
jgi:hypothetical protein